MYILFNQDFNCIFPLDIDTCYTSFILPLIDIEISQYIQHICLNYIPNQLSNILLILTFNSKW